MIIVLNKETQSETKLRGGYYTPLPIAQYLWKWVSSSKQQRILEPAAGDGALLKPITSPNVDIDAIEISPNEAEKIKKINSIKGKVNIYNEDFLAWYQKNRNKTYDILLSNPPYIRYQYLTPEQREIQSQILKQNGLKPNKLINSWVPFVVAGISMLRDSGKIGLVIPTDFLQVTYAKQLREYLYSHLQKMTIITFKHNVFPGTQQDFLLLLGEKGKENLKFKYANVDNLNDLPDIDKLPLIDPPSKSSSKWTDLNLTNEDRTFLKKFQARTIPFTKIAKAQVGITTGSNPFFSLTDKQMRSLKAYRYTKPLLGRSVSINSCFFNKEIFQNDAKNDQKIWLLDLNGYTKKQLPTPLKNYINEAESNHVNDAYKLKIRDVWYQIPNIWSPDGFLLRRIGKIPKLVLNDINGVSTDTFHRVNFYDNYNRNLILLSFYSSISLVSLELAGRSYGGGALEILPGDLSHLFVPDIDYSKDISLDNEVKELDLLISTNNIQKISQFADHVLKTKAQFKFDDIRFRKILNQLQEYRTNKK